MKVKNVVLIFFILLLASATLGAQSLTLNWIRIQKLNNGGQTVEPGDTMTVKCNYTLTDGGSAFDSMDGYNVGTESAADKIRVYWYINSTADTLYSTLNYSTVDVGRFVGAATTSGTYTDSVQVVVPEKPDTSVQTLKVRASVYGYDDSFNFVDSGVLYSTASGNYYAYLSYKAPSSAPTSVSFAQRSGSDLTNSDQTLRASYTLPSAATAGDVYVIVDDDATHPDAGDEDTATNCHAIIQLAGNNTATSHNVDLNEVFADTQAAISSVTGTSSLTHGSNYYFGIKYKDSSGNGWASTWYGSAITWDGSTGDPTGVSAEQRTGQSDPYLTTYYTLPEAALSGQDEVYIIIDDNASHPAAGSENVGVNVKNIIQLNGEDTAASHTVHLKVPFSAGESNITALNGGTTGLTAGSNYYIGVRYKDNYGNAYKTVWYGSPLTWDGSTLAPTGVSALQNTGTLLTVNYTLQEAGLEDAVYVYLDSDKVEGGGYDNIAQIDANNALQSHSFDLTIPLNEVTDSDVLAKTINTALADGDYYIGVKYQDNKGNAASSIVWSASTFAWSASADPATDVSASQEAEGASSVIDVNYTLPDAAANNTVEVFFDADKATDGGFYDIELTIAGNNTATAHNFNLAEPFSATEADADGDDVHSVDHGGPALAEGDYYIGIRYEDAYGFVSAITWSAATFSWDETSSPATDVSAVQQAQSGGGSPVLQVNYTLPEAGTSNSVEVLIDADKVAGYDHTLGILGNDTGAAHSFVLDEPFVDADDGGDGDDMDGAATTGGNLAAGTYWVGVRYVDQWGNATSTITWSAAQFTWNETTDAPTATTPSSTGLPYDNRDLAIAYTITESPLAGSVKLYISTTNDTTTGTVFKLTPRSADQTQGAHSFTIDGNNLTDDTSYSDAVDNITSVTGGTSLVNGTTYYYIVGYKDQYGNPYAVSTTTNDFVYDTAASTPTALTVSDPSADNDDVTINYTLAEDALDNEVTLCFDNNTSTADGFVACFNLTGNIAVGEAGAKTVTVQGNELDTSTYFEVGSGSGANTLTPNSSYYVTMRYYDEAGNQSSYATYTTAFTYTNDTTTDEPTGVTATQRTGQTSTYLTVNYTLPEAGTSNSVYILTDTDADHGSEGSESAEGDGSAAGKVKNIIRISGNDGASSYTLHIPVDFAVGGDVMAVTGTASLTNTTYYVGVRYQDAYGNDAQTVWYQMGSAWDNDTQAIATFTAPTADLYVNDNDQQTFPVTYQLPETGVDGTVKILLCNTNSSADPYTVLTLNTGADYNDTNSHTITVDADNLSNTAGVASVSNGNSLLDNSDAPEDYFVFVSYQDQYGNAIDYTSASRRIYFDDATKVPTLNDPADAGSTSLGTTDIAVDYDLTEAMDNIYLQFVSAARSAAVNNKSKYNGNVVRSSNKYKTYINNTATRATHRINITGAAYLTAANHTFTLDGSNLDALAGMAMNGGDGDALTTETTYTVTLGVQDAAGNTYETDISTGFVYQQDDQTQTPTLSAPTGNSYQDATISFTYNLPEPGTDGSVKFLIDNDDNHGNGYYTTLTLSQSQSHNTSGDHTIALEDMDNGIAANNTEIATANPQASLTDDNDLVEEYWVAVQYQDDQGNGAATSSWTKFYFDTTTKTPVVNTPASSSTFGGATFNLSFDLPEDAQDNSLYVEFTRTGGTADASSHKFRINNETAAAPYTINSIDPTNIDAHGAGATFTALDGASDALVSGAVYTIEVGYQDVTGNTLATASNTNCTYSSGTAELRINQVSVGTNPLDLDTDDQAIFGFSLNTTTSTATFTGITFTLTGSGAEAADFENNGTGSFHLWYSTDNSFSTVGDDDMGAVGGTYTDWTAQDFSSVGGTVTFSGSNAISISTTPVYFYLAIDTDANVTDTHTIGASINQASHVTTDASSTNGTGGDAFAITGTNYYLDGYVTATADGYGNNSLVPGQNNQAFYRFKLKTNQGTTNITGLNISLSGSTAQSSDFGTNGIKLLTDTDSDIAGATDLAAEDFTAGLVSFTGFSQSIGTADRYFFIAADVAGDADQSHKILAQITAASSFTTGFANQHGTFPMGAGEHALPVELSSFTAYNQGTTVTLRWTTSTETENNGFNLYRGTTYNALESGQVIKINGDVMISGAGTSTTPTDYEFADPYMVEFEQVYYYWIETVDLGGRVEHSIPLSFTPKKDGTIPGVADIIYGLQQNSPNPFNPNTTIRFTSKLGGQAILDIYNVKGQKVIRLFSGDVAADVKQEVIWNGKDDNGSSVGSGVYFYQLKMDGGVSLKRMLLLK